MNFLIQCVIILRFIILYAEKFGLQHGFKCLQIESHYICAVYIGSETEFKLCSEIVVESTLQWISNSALILSEFKFEVTL